MGQRDLSILRGISLEVDVTELVGDDDQVVEHTAQLKIQGECLGFLVGNGIDPSEGYLE